MAAWMSATRRWVLLAAGLLLVASPVLSGRLGNFLRGRYGGGRPSHGCLFDWNRSKTARLGSRGIHRFISSKAGLMSELCKVTASRGSYCDCRPAWQCPYYVTGPSGRACRLSGHAVGYCCEQSRTGITSRFSVGPAAHVSIKPKAVFSTHVTTTTYSFSYTTTTTTRPPLTIATTAAPDLCRPLVLCPEAVVDPLPLTVCQLHDGSLGVLCEGPPFDGTASSSRPLSETAERRQPFPRDRVVTEHFVTTASGGAGGAGALARAEAARAEAVRAAQAQTEQIDTLASAPDDSPLGIFNLNFRSDPERRQMAVQGLQQLLAVAALQRRTEYGRPVAQLVATPVLASSTVVGGSTGGGVGELASLLPPRTASTSSSRPLLVPGCEVETEPVCESTLYRTASGECNNLRHPRQGSAGTPYKRLLRATFDDGVLTPRSRSVTGRPLPSARLVSLRVVETVSSELAGFTLSVMQWGQFIDHDMAHTIVVQRSDGGSIECCQDEGRTFPTTPLHPQCIPIEIPADDPFYSRFRQRCMSLARSTTAPSPDCIARPATPTNELSGFLDAGNVYGNDDEELSGLRAFSGGLLLTSPGHLLPFTPPGTTGCSSSAVCFRAGDSRVNEQSGLTVIHTVFLREHNRVAAALQRLHPYWDDERLFQEARRIVIAEWQHIIYNEWLPIVIGFDYAREHNLLPPTSGFSELYNSSVDASVSNEFSTAAFRFGHSMVREMYDLINDFGRVTRTVNLTSTFFNPEVVAESLVEHARTLVARRPESFDTNVISGLHERLFQRNFPFGMDLIALNIQRGRDHGIPTYVTMLQACTDISVTRWSDLDRLMGRRAIDQLRAVYADPRDVDLFIGGLSEFHASGAQVGPTFQCLIGQQFFDARYGDRFYYDIGDQEHSFSAEQLAEIRKSSWARIMCDTLGAEFDGDFSWVQPLAFLEPGVAPNTVVRCSSYAVPTVDLSVF